MLLSEAVSRSLLSRREHQCVGMRASSMMLGLVVIISACTQNIHAWVDNTKPNVDVSLSDISREMKTFKNTISGPNHFKLLLAEGNSMLVGGRNIVYDINMETLKENKKIVWTPTELLINRCKQKMKTTEQCQNYVRVIARKSEQELLVCGTNAFSPTCRTYRSNFDTHYQYVNFREEMGIGRCPYDPDHNSTAVYAGGRLYSATVVDIIGQDSLIYSDPMRTVQHDSLWLNEPNFVSSFEYKDMIYYFLRETAVEYINCGKAVYSRVARICKKDRGHKKMMPDIWTSFFKSRLNCSIPGEYPFYFDEIQSTSNIGKGNYKPSINWVGTDMVYAVFTTPRNSISGSAVCAFRFSDVMKSFEGKFKEQKSPQYKWLPVSNSQVKTKCVNDSMQHDAQSLDFIKSHPLMDSAVPVAGGAPLLVHSGTSSRYTQIAIDWQVLSADRRHYDVMFIGTDNGRIIKAINTGKGGDIKTVIIEDILIFDDESPVVNLKVYKNSLRRELDKLIVISKKEIKSIPLHRCHMRKTCSDCVALQDPYCSWRDSKCMNSNLGLQNIDDGKHSSCPYSPTTGNGNSIVTPTTTPCKPCEPCVCAGRDTTATPLTTSTARNINQPATTKDMDNKVPTLKPSPSSTTVDGNEISSVNEIDIKDIETGASTMKEGKMYSVVQMAIAVALSVVLSLLAGALIGYRISVCRQSRFHSDTLHHIDSRAAEIRKNQGTKAEMSPYVNVNETPYIEVQKQLNVVLNLPPKGNNHLPNGSAETKVQPKVKKVYL